MRGLKGKRFVVAGAATGIGAATAKRLAEEGAHVVVGDINTAGMEKTVAEITGAGGVAKGFVFDFVDEPSCRALIEDCVQNYGGIDGLANVGADTRHSLLNRDLDLLQMQDDVWQRTLDVNLHGHIRTIRAALPNFAKQRDGAIVCVSSGAAHIGDPTLPAYATSKIALHTVIRHVARKWGPDNVRCNAISPGAVTTETSRSISGADPVHAAMRKKLEDSLPLKRAGTTAEVAASIAFLLSEDAAWVTGQVWSVNGGQVMRE